MKEEGVQYTIAYMHWGIEYQTTPSKQQTEMAQKLCDMGVDTLIGSHPHVIQPVDLLTSSDGKHQMVCAYAIGNFLSNQRAEYMQAEMPTGETEDSFLLTLSLSSDEKGKVTLTDVTFTPMWTYRYEDSAGAAFAVLPVNDTATLEQTTGLSGIKDAADASAARTQAIIGGGVEKVKAAPAPEIGHLKIPDQKKAIRCSSKTPHGFFRSFAGDSHGRLPHRKDCRKHLSRTPHNPCTLPQPPPMVWPPFEELALLYPGFPKTVLSLQCRHAGLQDKLMEHPDNICFRINPCILFSKGKKD